MRCEKPAGHSGMCSTDGKSFAWWPDEEI